ncbi:MAG: hypothetical protein R3C05_28720 [Pirellulaceae bacterium]
MATSLYGKAVCCGKCIPHDVCRLENGQTQFPDLGDTATRDPNEKPPTVTLDAATGTLRITGTEFDDAIVLERVGTQLRVSFVGGRGAIARKLNVHGE